MSNFAGPNNVPNKGKIPKVTHLQWLKQRCWHGEEVSLLVVAENVPNGTAAEIKIYTKGGKDVVDTISGLKVNLFMIAHLYKIDWKTKLPAKHGQEFTFKVTIGKLASGESPVLFVDVEPPQFSA